MGKYVDVLLKFLDFVLKIFDFVLKMLDFADMVTNVAMYCELQ